MRALNLDRYASLYFCMCVDADDNELETLEIIHHYVEILDRYFGNVSPYTSPTGLHVVTLCSMTYWHFGCRTMDTI